ncbi:hypothetical protein RFN58_34100 [Streptomyces iakyrus]|uniref:hypothetical protein n=1 Tax=Streptomyces iakyrus TaxID=68219 RepID=UPI00068BFDAA|nr:hypothetical protein [Streptomyces iakyrus]
MSQRVEHLLAAVDLLSYPHRMRELASAARCAAAEGAVDELVTGLAARHPALLLAEMERQLDTLPAVVRDGWLASHADALALLAERDPLGVLAVLERYETLPMPVDRKLHLLVEADPGRTVRLLLRPKLRPRLNSGHLEPAVLRRLVRHAPAELTDSPAPGTTTQPLSPGCWPACRPPAAAPCSTRRWRAKASPTRTPAPPCSTYCRTSGALPRLGGWRRWPAAGARTGRRY